MQKFGVISFRPPACIGKAILAFLSVSVLFVSLTTLAGPKDITKKDIGKALKEFKNEEVSEETADAFQKWFSEHPFNLRSLKNFKAWMDAHPDAALYVQTNWSRNGQNRLSFDRAAVKGTELFEENKIEWKDGQRVGTLPFDRGRSALPKTEAIPVAIMPDGTLAIIDGHHETAVSILAGAKTIPVVIVADLRKKFKTNKGAWAYLVRKDLAYLVKLDGTETEVPVLFSDVENDPNRMVASLIARRVHVEIKDGKKVLVYKKSPQDIWIKFEKGIPFIEFKIADILYSYKFVYKSEMGEKLSEKIIDELRRILLKEKKARNPALKEIAILKKADTKQNFLNKEEIERALEKSLSEDCAHRLTLFSHKLLL